MYFRDDVADFHEAYEYDEDVSVICQGVATNGYLLSEGSVFDDKFDYRQAMPPRSKRADKPPVKVKPKPKLQLVPKVAQPPVFDYLKYKAKRELEQAALLKQEALQKKQDLEREEAKRQQEIKAKAEQLVRDRNDFVLREMFANQNIVGRKWAIDQLNQLIPAHNKCIDDNDDWAASQFLSRINLLKSEYQI